MALFSCSTASVLVLADEIEVSNKTNHNLYAAVYYVDQGGERVTEPVFLESQTTVCINRPPKKEFAFFGGSQRQLVVCKDRHKLEVCLSRFQISSMFSANIGEKWGSRFYLVSTVSGNLKLYTQLGYCFFYINKLHFLLNHIETGFKKVHAIVVQVLKQTLAGVKSNLYKDRVAQVRQGNELSPEELLYVQKRKEKIRSQLARLMGDSFYSKKNPTVSIICSGGGYRAMFSTLGWLMGAQEIGLLDITTYVSGLSGSSWAIGTWMATGYSLAKLKDYLIHEFDTDITHIPNLNELKLVAHALLIKKAFGQPITLVDVYGGLIANKLLRGFEHCRQLVHLSEQRQKLLNGMIPFPIYTALSEERPHCWYEFTPYEIGSAQLGMYIPSWAFGRKFKAGCSIDFAPEQSLGFEFGIFGSAFAADFAQVYDKIVNKLPYDLDNGIKSTLVTVAKRRLTYAMVFNFTYGIQESVKKKERFVKLIDAAFDFNLAYPPVSGVRPDRASDVLIFLDSSNYSQEGKRFGDALYKAEEYARKHKLAFPELDCSDLGRHAVTIFRDEKDSSVPLVIYMPLIRDNVLWEAQKDDLKYSQYKSYLDDFDPQDCIKFSYCSTFNFRYTCEQIEQLTAQTEYNMKASREVVIDAIKWKLGMLQE